MKSKTLSYSVTHREKKFRSKDTLMIIKFMMYIWKEINTEECISEKTEKFLKDEKWQPKQISVWSAKKDKAKQQKYGNKFNIQKLLFHINLV
jgi:hypothetical protein